MTDYAELATVIRGGFEESRHFGSLIALDPDGSIALKLGRPQYPILPRSSIKPVQALTALEAGADLGGYHLALAAASHQGEDEHVRGVREMLTAANLTEEDLGCPPDMPGDSATHRRLIRERVGKTRIRMNCSGKHAGMLVACVAAGWPTATYLDPGHPLQQHIAANIEDRAGERITHVTVDGCGAPLFGFSLTGLARAVRSTVVDEPGTPGRLVADAMRAHPFYVAGTDHPNTVVMEKLPGVLCKGGAEGVIVAVTAAGRAVAAKVIDGNSRATTAIALAALAALGEDISAAADLAAVPVYGGGRPVGEIRPHPSITLR